MKKEVRTFIRVLSVMIIILAGLGFVVAWFLSERKIALGTLAGAGIGMMEMELNMLIFPLLSESGSRRLWGALLGVKSLLVLGLIGVLLLGLKISGIGFIIGFSEVILSLFLVMVWFRPGRERDKG